MSSRFMKKIVSSLLLQTIFQFFNQTSAQIEEEKLYDQITSSNWETEYESQNYADCLKTFPDINKMISNELIQSNREYNQQELEDPKNSLMYSIAIEESKVNKDLENLKVMNYFFKNLGRYILLFVCCCFSIIVAVSILANFVLGFVLWQPQDIEIIEKTDENGVITRTPNADSRFSLRLISMLVTTCCSFGSLGLMWTLPTNFMQFSDALNHVYCSNFALYTHMIKPVANNTQWAGVIQIKEVVDEAYNKIYGGTITYNPAPWASAAGYYNTLMGEIDNVYFSRRTIKHLGDRQVKHTPTYLKGWGPTFWPDCLSSKGKFAEFVNKIYYNHKQLFDSLKRLDRSSSPYLQMILHHKMYADGEHIFMISDLKTKMTATLSNWYKLYLGLQDKYFLFIIKYTKKMSIAIWAILLIQLSLFVVGVSLDCVFTFRRHNEVLKKVSAIIWFCINPISSLLVGFIIIFAIISDSYEEQSIILAPYVLNRTFFYSVEGDAFYYNKLPGNFKEILWPCLYQGNSLLTKDRMDNFVKISTIVDDDLSTAIRIANQTNLSGIKIEYDSLISELNLIRSVELHMNSQPEEQFDPVELLIRLNTYMDCGVTPIYRKAFDGNKVWYDIDTKRSCGGFCKAQILIVFHEKDCPPGLAKIKPISGFYFTNSDLDTRKCQYLIDDTGALTDTTDAINNHDNYLQIRDAVSNAHGCIFVQDPTVLRGELYKIFDQYLYRLRVYIVETQVIVDEIKDKLDNLMPPNTKDAIDTLNNDIQTSVLPYLLELKSTIDVLHENITKEKYILNQNTNCNFMKFGLHHLKDKTLIVFDIGKKIVNRGKLCAGMILLMLCGALSNSMFRVIPKVDVIKPIDPTVKVIRKRSVLTISGYEDSKISNMNDVSEINELNVDQNEIINHSQDSFNTKNSSVKPIKTKVEKTTKSKVDDTPKPILKQQRTIKNRFADDTENPQDKTNDIVEIKDDNELIKSKKNDKGLNITRKRSLTNKKLGQGGKSSLNSSVNKSGTSNTLNLKSELRDTMTDKESKNDKSSIDNSKMSMGDTHLGELDDVDAESDEYDNEN